MPKVDVDKVTLIAVQELPSAVTPTKDWPFVVGDPTPGSKKAYKIPIEVGGAIIAEQMGSAANVPDRVYEIGGMMPDGVTFENDDDPLSPTFGLPIILKDPYLDGKEFSLFRRGTEYMWKGPQWQNDVAGGGIRLTEVGDYFADGAIYGLIFKPVISSVISTPDAVGRFTSGVQVVTGDAAAGPSFDRKLILLQAVTAVAPTYTLNTTYPENVLCVVRTGGGAQKQSIIVPPAGQTMVRGGVVPRIVLGEVDYFIGLRIGTVWYVVSQGERWKQVGLVAMGGIPGPDMLRANRQTLQINEFPGVDDYCTALSAAYPGSVVTLAQAAANPTKWARGATTILVPLLDGWFPRFLDLGAGKDTDRAEPNVVGSVQASQNLAHDHAEGDYDQLLQKNGQGTAIAFDNDPSGQQPDLRTAEAIPVSGGTEARPENVGFPALIHI